MRAWPATAEQLIRKQEELARATPETWHPGRGPLTVGGCFICFERGPADGPGRQGDRGWAGSALVREGEAIATAVATGEAGAAYEPGLLALREGPLLEAAVRQLPESPDCLLVNATGRDHPRRAGLAVQLGAILELPTAGVTHRLLLAEGEWPPDEQDQTSPIRLEHELVGYWLRTRRGTRPLAIHAAWRTDPDSAVAAVRASLGRARTPEPLRQARRAARAARAAAT